MNRTYRLVWNRGLRVLQVASELTRAPAAGGAVADGCSNLLSRRPLARACAAGLALMLAGVALPLWAAAPVCPANTICGANGGDATRSSTGGTAGVGSNPGSNNGGAGGYIGVNGHAGQGTAGSGGGGATSTSAGAGGSASDGGGAGGAGFGYGSNYSGGGGAGGGLANGGIGGGAGGGYGAAGSGAGGGGGGLGLAVSGSYTTAQNIRGGYGGLGARGYQNLGGGLYSGGGSGGGGAGVLVTNAGSFTVASGFSISGGASTYGSYWAGGGGGGGGAGVLMAAGGTLSNGGTITGGYGGYGGYAAGGNGGDGVAVAALGTGFTTVDNQAGGGITGGHGGRSYGCHDSECANPGAGGDGLLSLGNLYLNNAGTITGGAGGYNDTYLVYGDGGPGGTGLSAGGTGNSPASRNSGGIYGGVGGHGGHGGYAASGSYSVNGGAGGTGASLSDFTLTNTGTIRGGTGGTSGAGYFGAIGIGGSGGAGAALSNGSVLTNSGTLAGGVGGAGGNGFRGSYLGSNGGTGGAGAVVNGSTLTNTGSLSGGAGGIGGLGANGAANGIVGLGGVGAVGTGGANVINSGTISGGLSGDGATQADAVDFSGGGNTLTLESGYAFVGNVVSSSGTTNGGDMLAVGGSVDDSFDLGTIVSTAAPGDFAGFNRFGKSGTSTWTLSGNASFGGGTEVMAGTLLVGDSSHADTTLGGTVTVDSGGTLGGYGTVGGIDTSGTVDPGGSIGTLHVSGDVTFESGSTFAVDAASDGTSDLLAVGGKASLKGGSVVVRSPNGTWLPQTRYTILSANGGVSGQFTSVSDNLPFLDAVLGYESNAVELSLFRNDINFNTVAITPNQIATATAASSLDVSSPLFDSLLVLDAASARAAFDQLSGELHASQQTARVDDSRFVREAMDERLSESGTGALNAWVHAWGHWGSVDGDGNAAKLSDNGDGLLVGADLPVAGQERLGVTAGSARNSLSVQDRNSWGRTTSTWLGMYGGFGSGPFALRTGVAYAWDRIPVNRQIEFPGVSGRVSSDASGSTLTGFIEGAWKIHTASGDYEPYLNFAHVRLGTDSTTEAGADAALHAFSESENVSFSTLGARGTWQFGGTELHGGLGWQHAFGDTTPQRTEQFVDGGDAFTVYGMPVAQNAAVVTFGADWKLSPSVTLDASYNGQWANSVRDEAAKLSLDVSF